MLPHGSYAAELEFYVKDLGIPPLDVLRWATRHGAEAMGRGASSGGSSRASSPISSSSTATRASTSRCCRTRR